MINNQRQETTIVKPLQDQLHIENESKTTNNAPEHLERLLGNRSAPTLILPSAQICAPKLDRRRKSDNSIFGSFQRIRMSFSGASGKDAIGSHVFSRYRQSRFNARRIRKRVVFKHGDCNVVQGNVAKRRRKYLQDIFTTLVDAQWRWTLLVFAMNFMMSWLLFALVWWLIVYTHGDLSDEHLSDTEAWTPCITNVHSFTSCFLFSVETQHTIGYGGRTTTEECPEAIFVMCIQSIAGVMIQAFMVGVVFAKLSRPKKRTQTLLFSRNAVISHRDGIPCLMFRVGDMRKSHIIEAHVRAQLIKHKVTKEGEHLPFFQTELKVGGDGEEDKIFFIWPTTIVHKIDNKSPLYNMSATDLLRERFEIVVILEGVIESTGMTTQARSSYLPSEILWGHRFQSLISYKKDAGEYEVDYAVFNNTIEVDTPLCSARELDEHRAMLHGECMSDSKFLTVKHNYDHLRSGFPSVRTHSSDSLSSLDSMFIDDGHIEMKIPNRNDSFYNLKRNDSFYGNLKRSESFYANLKRNDSFHNGCGMKRNDSFHNSCGMKRNDSCHNMKRNDSSHNMKRNDSFHGNGKGMPRNESFHTTKMPYIREDSGSWLEMRLPPSPIPVTITGPDDKVSTAYSDAVTDSLLVSVETNVSVECGGAHGDGICFDIGSVIPVEPVMDIETDHISSFNKTEPMETDKITVSMENETKSYSNLSKPYRNTSPPNNHPMETDKITVSMGDDTKSYSNLSKPYRNTDPMKTDKIRVSVENKSESYNDNNDNVLLTNPVVETVNIPLLKRTKSSDTISLSALESKALLLNKRNSECIVNSNIIEDCKPLLNGEVISEKSNSNTTLLVNGDVKNMKHQVMAV